MSTTPLGLKEAGPLAYPLVHRVLADHGIRALFLKGSVAAAQRLRPTRTSNDIDVLCDASAMAAAEHLLDGLGWFRYSGAETDMMAIGMHATTFCIPGWPCTVDVHSHFPGLLAAPQDAFDYLWRRRVPVVLAHQAVPAPAPEDHLMVLWLHLLRGLRPDQEEGARAQFALGWKALTPEQQERAVASARPWARSSRCGGACSRSARSRGRSTSASQTLCIAGSSVAAFPVTPEWCGLPAGRPRP